MEMVDLNDLGTLVLAYGSVEDDAPPLLWTATQVQIRLVDAFKVVMKTVSRPGPRAFGNSLPDVVREFADYAGRHEAEGERLEKWMQDVEMSRRNDEFSALQFDLADEAITWASRFLSDSPMLADALQVWALGVSRGLGEKGFAKLLRRRALAADAMVERRKQDAPDKIIIYEQESEQAARKIAAWANSALAREHAELTRPLRRDEKRRTSIEVRKAKARIKMAAHIMFRREIKVVKAVEREVRIHRVDVMPNRIFSVRNLDRYRKLGAILLAERLGKNNVLIR